MTDYQIGDEVTPTPAKTPIRPKKQDRTTIALLFIAALVAVGGIGFALGHLTAPATTAAANPSGAFGGLAADVPSHRWLRARPSTRASSAAAPAGAASAE